MNRPHHHAQPAPKHQPREVKRAAPRKVVYLSTPHTIVVVSRLCSPPGRQLRQTARARSLELLPTTRTPWHLLSPHSPHEPNERPSQATEKRESAHAQACSVARNESLWIDPHTRLPCRHSNGVVVALCSSSLCVRVVVVAARVSSPLGRFRGSLVNQEARLPLEYTGFWPVSCSSTRAARVSLSPDSPTQQLITSLSTLMSRITLLLLSPACNAYAHKERERERQRRGQQRAHRESYRARASSSAPHHLVCFELLESEVELLLARLGRAPARSPSTRTNQSVSRWSRTSRMKVARSSSRFAFVNAANGHFCVRGFSKRSASYKSAGKLAKQECSTLFSAASHLQFEGSGPSFIELARRDARDIIRTLSRLPVESVTWCTARKWPRARRERHERGSRSTVNRSFRRPVGSTGTAREQQRPSSRMRGQQRNAPLAQTRLSGVGSVARVQQGGNGLLNDGAVHMRVEVECTSGAKARCRWWSRAGECLLEWMRLCHDNSRTDTVTVVCLR